MEFFSIRSTKIGIAERPHQTWVHWYNIFYVWGRPLKVQVIHASVTQNMLSKMSKTMCGFGLDCAKLSGYSGRKAWQLSTIQTKSAHGLVAFCSTNFEWRRHESPKLLMACPKPKKIISMNSRLMWLFSNTNFSRANSKKIPCHQLEGKLFSRV